jgi:lactate dehydrogenase-like 2-hydroxyacid dehydrogenase
VIDVAFIAAASAFSSSGETARSLLAITHQDGFVFHAAVVIMAPNTAPPVGPFDAKAIACLPRGAVVVNAARGGIVVDEDLIAALKSGQVAAAGLDTYEGEPKLNPGYLSLKNLFLLPHIGAATIGTRTAMGVLALDNIDAVLGGRTAPSLVT